jgi:two-component system LytT family response regulator
VDDEPLARKVIEKHLQSFPQLTLQGSVESAKAVFELLNTQNIHLIFLDIQMPLVDGLQFIRSMRHPPSVIFTTAYTEYAAESYILDAIDYLVKPVSLERCERGINKFLKSIQPEPVEEKQFLLVKQDGKLSKVFLNTISYVEARKDYLMIHTPTHVYIKHMTMKAIEGMLPDQQFKRVHRSFIVSADAITQIDGNTVEISGKAIPIGDKYRKEVMALFRGNNKFR